MKHLVQGKELLYLTWFFNNLAYNPSAVTMLLAVGGSSDPALGSNVTDCTVSSCTLYAMKTLAQNVQGIQIPNSDHWGPEERPQFAYW